MSSESDKDTKKEELKSPLNPENAKILEVADSEDDFQEFKEENFDEDFDDDFEEEVKGEYNLEDDQYGDEFNQEFGHLTEQIDMDEAPDD